jgi:putative membrane-bound dehydrogenase-like protein
MQMIDQGKHDPRLKGYFTPSGIKVEIVAEFPVVVNPIGMAFDEGGALFVLEGPQKENKNSVKVLRTDQQQGIYTAASTVLEGEPLSSILAFDGWLYVAGKGIVRRSRSAKPGGRFEIKEEIARGFCGSINEPVMGLAIGNEGWLYISCQAADHDVEGTGGSRVKILRTGAVFRCRPDGSRMQVCSVGYSIVGGSVAFDRSMNPFLGDSDYSIGRVMHAAEGSDFGFRLFRLAGPVPCSVPEDVRDTVLGAFPGTMTAMHQKWRELPAGILIYNDTRLPEKYRGLLLCADRLGRRIDAYRLQPAGSTFGVAESWEFMRSSDPLFRPGQMVAGPDGALYLCDRRADQNERGGDDKHGRLYRITWIGTGEISEENPAAMALRGMDSWARVAKQRDEELLDTLGSPESTDRRQAQRELLRRGARLRPHLLKLVQDDDQPLDARIAALGVLENWWNSEVQKALVGLLNDREADLQRLAADGLALNAPAGDRAVQAALFQVLNAPDLSVRRAVALAMGRLGAAGAADDLVNAYKFEDRQDSYLHNGLVRAIEQLGKPGIDALVSLAYSGVARDRDRAIEAFLTLRSRPAAEALPQLLNHPHVTNAQRAALLRSYRNYLLDPPISLKPVVTFLSSGNRSSLEKLAGLEVLCLGDGFRETGMQLLLSKFLDDKDSRVRLSVVRVVADRRSLAPQVADALQIQVEQNPALAKMLEEIRKGTLPKTTDRK